MLLLTPALFADQVTLKNGDRLSGTILKSDAKTLVLKTEAAGEVTFQWAAIDAITSSAPLHVGLAGGQMVVGPVATKDGQLQVSTSTSGVVTAAKDSVQVIRSDSEEAAYDAAMERLQHPHLGDFWSGTLDTGLSLTRGNSSTLAYTLAGRAVRATDRDKITVYTTAVYGKNNTTSPGEVIAHQITGRRRPRYFSRCSGGIFRLSTVQISPFNCSSGAAGVNRLTTTHAIMHDQKTIPVRF